MVVLLPKTLRLIATSAKGVMLWSAVCVFVCPLVCQQDYTETNDPLFQTISVGGWAREEPIQFGTGLNKGVNAGFFFFSLINIGRFFKMFHRNMHGT